MWARVAWASRTHRRNAEGWLGTAASHGRLTRIPLFLQSSAVEAEPSRAHSRHRVGVQTEPRGARRRSGDGRASDRLCHWGGGWCNLSRGLGCAASLAPSPLSAPGPSASWHLREPPDVFSQVPSLPILARGDF